MPGELLGLNATEAFLNEAPQKSLFLFKKKKKSSLDEWNVIQSSCTQPPLEKASLGLGLHFTAPNSTGLSRPLTGLQEVGGKLYRVCPVNQKNEPASAPVKTPRSPGASALLSRSTVPMLSGARWVFQTRACENTHCTCTQSPTAGAFTRAGQLCMPRRHSVGSVFTFRAHSHPCRLVLISLPVKLSLPWTQD